MSTTHKISVNSEYRRLPVAIVFNGMLYREIKGQVWRIDLEEGHVMSTVWKTLEHMKEERIGAEFIYQGDNLLLEFA